MMLSKQQYDHLKTNILLNKQNYSQNFNHVVNLRHLFENKINSTRRSFEIRTIEDLIEILETRDCVSQDNIKILEDIAQETGNQHFLNYINNMRNPIVDISNQNNLPNIYPSPVDNAIKIRVYNNIATKMGNKWTEFARALKVVECKIDQWRLTHGNNFELCTREVLNFHEGNVHRREWKTKLLEGLEEARRKDLSRETNKIFDDFSEP